MNGTQFALLSCLAFGLGFPALVYLDYEVVRPLLARFRPPAGRESPPPAVTAPGGVTQWRGTPNHLSWLHVSLFLQQGSAPCPRSEAIGPRLAAKHTTKE